MYSTVSQPPRLVSRSGQLQGQGFSVEVAERMAAPQRSSTRTIYKSKWALFEKWCRENSVDFSTPSVKHISDFFMYLYQDLNSSDLHRLLSSFYRDRPKSSRNLPKRNLSVVLNELTKAPFEPMKDRPQTSYFQNCFLASFDLRQAPQRNPCVGCKVSNLGQWEMVTLFPSDFIAKNQLARLPCSLLTS